MYSSKINPANYALLVFDDLVWYKTGYFGLCFGNVNILLEQYQEVTTVTFQNIETQGQEEIKFKRSKIKEIVDEKQGIIRLYDSFDSDLDENFSGIVFVKDSNYYRGVQKSRVLLKKLFNSA